MIYVCLQLRCCSHRRWEDISWAGRGHSAPRRGRRAGLDSSFAFWTVQKQRSEFSISAGKPETCGEICNGTFPKLQKMVATIYWVSLHNRCFSYALSFNLQQHGNFMRWVRKMNTSEFNQIVPGWQHKQLKQNQNFNLHLSDPKV